MTVSQKGLRKLTHNGILFGWTIRAKPTYNQAAFKSSRMTLAIQPMNVEAPQTLHVTLNISRPDNWVAPSQTQITPKVIRDIIDTALKNGWQYDAGGKAYELKYAIVEQLQA